MRPDSRVRDRVGVAVLPRGEGPDGRHADVLGGFHLMVSRTSKHKRAAFELVRFLASPEIQRVNATTRGYAPTRPNLYTDPAIIRTNPFFEPLRHVLLEGAVTRPSTVAGARYGDVSGAYFTAVGQALLGRESADAAVEALERDVRRILSSPRAASQARA
jgi:trehalose/maltose transport system substrate-binding protein